MSKRWIGLIEDAIVGKLLAALIDDGYRLEISNQDGGGLFVYAAPDGGGPHLGKYNFWVRLVLGNGADVIADYTTNLEAVLKPVNDFAAEWQD